MITPLLTPETHPLDRLRMHRIQLDGTSPAEKITSEGEELLLYSLVGRADVYADGRFLGSLGGRKQVTEPLVHVIRFPRGWDFSIVLTLQGFAADLLCLSLDTETCEMPSMRHPYLHWNDTIWNDVGEGTYARRVAEVPTPAGFELYCGETLNIPGGTSSWPPHASADDIERYRRGETTWNEVMFFSAQAPAMADLRGLYTGGVVVQELVSIANGSAHVMPLGSHAITANPASYLHYVWAYYGTALQKQYRKFASDTHIYVK